MWIRVEGGGNLEKPSLDDIPENRKIISAILEVSPFTPWLKVYA
jgi:hypothetical protein